MARHTTQQIAAGEDWWAHPTDHCFYCGEPLTGNEWVYWQGADERGIQIWLHIWCVVPFTNALRKWK